MSTVAASDLQIQHRVIKYLEPKQSKRAFKFNPPRFPKEHCFMEPSQTSSIFLLVKRKMWMKMSMEIWKNDTEGERRKH